MAIATTVRLQSYLDTFSALQASTERQPVWLRALRERAFAQFCGTGFPTTHVEDWRFTNVAPIAQTAFQRAQQGPQNVSLRDVEAFGLARAACRLVFVNGRFAAALSSNGHLPSALQAGPLAEKIIGDGPSLEPHLGRYLNIGRDPFCALNTALFEDGAYVQIRQGGVIEEPIHLLFVSTAEGAPAMNHPRNLIVAGANAQATFIEEYVSLNGAALFCNSATELVAGDGAVISHYRIERENTHAFDISTLRIQQGRSASVMSHSLLMGGGLVRNNVHPVLAGEGGECIINGLFMGSGRQHLDNYMLVEHVSPHCGSRQFYNGILDGHSHGVFHGRIIVHKDAQKTDAKQTNRNLLLSDHAQIDTKPQLEIYADDVKCTHGATIGQMEESALFYLRSRGIDEGSARRILLLAFANECLDRMKEPVARAHVEKLIHRRLQQLARPEETPAAGESARQAVAQNWGEAL